MSPAPAAEPAPTALLRARWVLTLADGDGVRDDAVVAVEDGRVVDVLDAADARSRWPDAPVTDLGERVLMPGLVNGHGHAGMTLMRGFADDMALEPWLAERIWPLEGRWVDDDFVAAGTELAIAEMIADGTTTYSDMYFFPEAAAAVADRTGLRAQVCTPLIMFPNAWTSGVEDGLDRTAALLDEYAAHPRVRIAFGPHSTYTLEARHLARIATLAEAGDVRVQIHLHETANEVFEARRTHGERPIDAVMRSGLFGPRLQAVHMTQLEDVDFERLAEHDVAVIHCPQSNLKLASGTAELARLRAAGVRVGLGTDGAASNNALSMFRELHVAALLGKIVAGDAAALPAREMLRMATLGGAEALGLGDVTGSLEAGKAADLIAVDLSAPACRPVFDPISQLVYTGTHARVTHVWVDGRPLLEDGVYRTLDVDAVTARADGWRDRMLEAAHG